MSHAMTCVTSCPLLNPGLGMKTQGTGTVSEKQAPPWASAQVVAAQMSCHGNPVPSKRDRRL